MKVWKVLGVRFLLVLLVHLGVVLIFWLISRLGLLALNLAAGLVLLLELPGPGQFGFGALLLSVGRHVFEFLC